MVLWELLVVLLLILLNGFFALSELAVISSRRARLEAWAKKGRRGARSALALLDDSSRFLSSVQIGITLVGILAGAFSGATLAGRLAAPLREMALFGRWADEVAFAAVVVGVTYLTLVAGELVPKQLALRTPERIAMGVAAPMHLLARIAAPAVWLLDFSTRWGVRLFGGQRPPGQEVTEEEIKMLITEATSAGVVEQAEQEMIAGVMRLADRPVEAIMTPRPDIVWLDADEEPATIEQLIRESGFSRFPVARGDLDNLLGIVQAKDMLNLLLSGQPLQLQQLLHEPNIVPEGVDALHSLELLKPMPLHMALIVDEYGSVQGLVTETDIMEAIVGQLVEPSGGVEAEIVVRDDGTLLMDGSLATDRLKEVLRLDELPEEGEFHTLAGFILSQLARVPRVGECLDWNGYTFEVVDMDGHRIDKVLLSKGPLIETGEGDGAGGS